MNSLFNLDMIGQKKKTQNKTVTLVLDFESPFARKRECAVG